MDSSSSPSPSRRRSLAMQLSPRFISSDEAIQLKRLKGAQASLRKVVCRELTLNEASAHQQSGGELLVSPKGLGTNERFEDMKKTMSDIGHLDLQELASISQAQRIRNLYFDFVGVGWQFCEFDLIATVLHTLNYYLMRAFKTNASYHAWLVPEPFTTSDVDNVRYSALFRFVERGRFASGQQRRASRALLAQAEQGIMNAAGATVTSDLRAELRKYFSTSDLREFRIFGSHIFSSMLEEAHTLIDVTSAYPPIKPESFNLVSLKPIRFMALRALVLKDLEERFGNSGLNEECNLMHTIGFALVKKIMALHVPFSFKVSYGELFAEVVREGESVDDITMDHIYELGARQGAQ